MLRTIRAFWHDQRGIALILVSVMLPAIIGFSLLVIDMSRANSLHNDLQKGADAFALAAAAELDGGTDAIIRADRALASLVDNTYRFSDQGSQQILATGGITRRYLNSLPADDSSPIVAANLITDEINDAADARFVEVTVTPTGFAAIFPASFITGNSANNSFTVGAKAVAGFNSAVCDFTPVFICNPYEMVNGTNDAGGITLQQAVAERKYRRRLIQLRTVGNNAGYFPGNFGFLETDGKGAKSLATALASAKPGACYSKNNITTATGQKAGKVKGAINLRFGMQEPGSNFNGAEFGPAENVRKGGKKTSGGANSCPSSNNLTFDVAGQTQSLGLDSCFKTGTCTMMGGRMGGGDWDLNTSANAYWKINHVPDGVALPADLQGTGDNLPTRYEVYKYENNHIPKLIPDKSKAPGNETGTPAKNCEAPITYVDRRLLYGAVIDCQKLEADPNVNLGGHTENLPVEAFASFFITQAVRTDRCTGKGTTCFDYDADIFVELVDVTGHAGQGTLNNFLRDEPQLYR
ncbi:pilus assembly protein TadG-related protein [Mesorhizobium sp. M0276]|uniref:TadE/TadG family type IV pilus assembly protein n=1 Tax=Mesorhizobium sp. M0276 TaxID=2956928 RepID=UPI0033363B38